MDKIKNIMIAILVVSLGISLTLNIFLASSKEIHSETVHNQQHYLNKSHATLIMSVFAAQGTLSWKAYTEEYLIKKGFQTENTNSIDATTAFLNSLKPEQALMAKVVIERNGYYHIIVPIIVEDKGKYDESKVWEKIK